jgi:hypothetical protein
MRAAIGILALLVALDDRNASESPGTQSEISIAVDRFRPNVLVAAAMNFPDGRLMTMASRDSGESFERGLIPLSPGALIHADPMVAFDTGGRVFLAHIPVGPGNTPLGIEVSRSLDSGQSWSEPLRISTATDRDDKVILAIDDNPESPYRDALYVAWKWPSQGIFVSRSLDGGESFTRPKLVEVATASGLDLTIARDGAVYLGFNDLPRASIRVARSNDGAASFEPSVEVAPVRARWYTATPSICQRQSLVHASLGVDRTGTSSEGAVYVTWADYAVWSDLSACASRACDSASPCTTNVYFSRTSDGGRSWSSPVVVHETSKEMPIDRYHQWTDVDPRDGFLYVAYKDTRLDPERAGTDVYLSRSTDCGLSWEDSLRVSSATSFATSSDFQYGDYQGLSVVDGAAYPAWADFRGGGGAIGESEVYVGRVRLSEGATGFSIQRQSSDAYLVSFRGRVSEPVLADFYVMLGDAEGGVEAYVTHQGVTKVARPFASGSVSGAFQFDVQIPASTLAGFEEGLLSSVLRSAAAATDLSSTLRVRTRDLRSGPPTCR